MSARASSLKPGVFGPYDAERDLARDIETVYCTRCPLHGRRTALVLSPDAIGRLIERCPVCDGVAKPRRHTHDEVFRPQALIGRAQLLPPCPPGRLRCQSCARPVEGDERLCIRCALPGLSKADRAKAHREREDREATKAPARPRPEMPLPLYSSRGPVLHAPAKAKPKAAPGALAKAVADVQREKKQRPVVAKAPRVRTCLNCGATSPYTAGRLSTKDCDICVPKVAGYKPKQCQYGRCRTMFTPAGPAARYCEEHR